MVEKTVWGSAMLGLNDSALYSRIARPACIHSDELEPNQPCMRCTEEGYLSGFVPSALVHQDIEKCVRALSSNQRLVLIDQAEVILIAGGFIRSVIAEDRIKDVDFFVSSKPLAEKIVGNLTSNMNPVDVSTHKSDWAITVYHRDQTPAQFIYAFPFEDPTDVIKSFDLTVCQTCIWFGKDGCWRGMCGPTFYQDLAAKRLVYTKPQGRNQDIRLIGRVIKHLKLGYHIQGVEIGKIISTIIVNCFNDLGLHSNPPAPDDSLVSKVENYITERIKLAHLSPNLDELSRRQPSGLLQAPPKAVLPPPPPAPKPSSTRTESFDWPS